MKEKKNVLIIDNSIGFTGAFKSITYLCNLLSNNYDFHFALPTKSTNDRLIKTKFKTIKVPFIEINRSWKLPLYLPYLLINSFTLLSYCRKKDIRIIHVNDIYNMTGVMIKILSPKIKIIYHIRLLPDLFPKILFSFWVKMISRFANDIIAVSECVKKNFNKWTSGHIQVIYNTIPLIEKYGSEICSDAEFITLLYVANYTQGKGQDYALYALINTIKVIPNIKLKFIGDDFGLRKNIIFKRELNDIIKENHLEGFVEFINHTTDIEKYIKDSDIILNFSNAESFSMTCYEALYYGKPLIATDCGGPSELFIDRSSGWIVHKKDIASMTSAIIKLAENKELRNDLGKNAKEHISLLIAKNALSVRMDAVYRSN